MDTPNADLVILFKNISIFTDGEIKKSDVLIENGVYKEISENIISDKAYVISGENYLLSPGFTDLHVHLRQPGYEAKETILTGTKAAAAGGFTTICAMPNLSPVPDSMYNLQEQLDIIEKDALIRVLPYGAITKEQKGIYLADINDVSNSVCGFTDDGFGVDDEDLMYKAMKKVAAGGKFIAAHCELKEHLPQKKKWCTVQESCKFAKINGLEGVNNESEWAEVARDIDICKELFENGKICHLHICHSSTQKTFELVKKAKEKGLPVSCEVSPHNALFSCEDISENDGRFKMNPPLRFEADRKAAAEAIKNGIVDAIATDHAPHTKIEKSGGFENSLNGVVGLETAFAAMYTGFVVTNEISTKKLLELFINGPAKILGEEANSIEKNKKANCTLIDLNMKKKVAAEEFLSMGRSTPFEGQALKGWPVLTYYKGSIVYNKILEI